MVLELERFLLLAKKGNVTRTAEQMFITQSALTQSMHRLEKELGTKLFHHNGKYLELTDEGKSLMPLAEKIVKLWATAHTPQLKTLKTPSYSVGMFDNVALLLATYFQKLMQERNYKLELSIDTSGKLMTQLTLGILDAGLCVLNKTFQPANHITLLHTYTEQLIPVSSKIFSSQVAIIPFILYNRGSNTRQQIDEIFAKHKINPTVYAESTSVTFMKELAIRGFCVALLPENFVIEDIKRGKLKRQQIPIKWTREYGLFTQKYFDQKKLFIRDLQNALTKVNG